jgi:hypothetical protein
MLVEILADWTMLEIAVGKKSSDALELLEIHAAPVLGQPLDARIDRLHQMQRAIHSFASPACLILRLCAALALGRRCRARI